MKLTVFRSVLLMLAILSVGVVLTRTVFADDSDSTIPSFDKPSSDNASAPVTPVQTEPLAPQDWKAQAKQIMEERCGVCHVVPQISAYSQTEWPSIINKMAPRAMLRPDDMQLLLKYVQDTGASSTPAK